VLDEAGDFERRANLEMAELLPIDPVDIGTAGEMAADGIADLVANLDADDARRLYTLVSRHVRYTNSAKAKAILADWAGWLPKFKKVMPVEFRDALKKLAAAEEAAAHPDQVR